MRIADTLIRSVIVCAILGASTWALADDDSSSGHKNHLALILGTTIKSGKTAETYGVEYTYRISDRLALGG